MKLSTGKVVTSTIDANGSRIIEQELTEQEWEEYCKLKKVVLVAERLRGNKWSISPANQLGTCGYWPYAWTVEYVNARSEQEALRKATYSKEHFKKWQATLA